MLNQLSSSVHQSGKSLLLASPSEYPTLGTFDVHPSPIELKDFLLRLYITQRKIQDASCATLDQQP